MSTTQSEFYNEEGVRSDWVDLRDQNYVPGLTVLAEEITLDPDLLEDDPETGLRAPVFGVRRQRGDGRCVGYALANLIDIQRNLQSLRRARRSADASALRDGHARKNIVSADMLYMMAYFHDRYPELEGEHEGPEGIRTLRSAIKGFYHHGVCLDWPEASGPAEPHRWQSIGFFENSPDRHRRFPTVEQAKKAREISVGAYYRLASILNHFHAALNEAGAVLTTANIHDGWGAATPANGGVIAWPPKLGKTGAHAFVLTGYDENGFHVLNSWGKTWGGYRGQAGIALWSYADWAQNVIDSWVLRLGVYAPTAFDASIGEQGTKGLTAARAGSVPCFELVGHYMHLDDGYHVGTGSYPSFDNGWQRTRTYLASHLDAKAEAQNDQSHYHGLLVWISGGFEGIRPAFSAAVQRKNTIKDIGLYPYTVFWCNSLAEQSMAVFQDLFESCKKRAGERSEHLDELIEDQVRGIGRAIWRDIEMCARRAVRGTGELPFEPDDPELPQQSDIGHVGTFLADLLELKDSTGCELHVVAEGAGALVVHEMLALLKEDARKKSGQRRFARRHARQCIDTLHLVQPAIGLPRAERLLLPFIKELNPGITGRRKRRDRSEEPVVQPLLNAGAEPHARIYVPTPDLQDRMRFGSYGKSILHLVSRAFEDRMPESADSDNSVAPIYRKPRPFLGQSETVTDSAFAAPEAVYMLNRFDAARQDSEPVARTTLNNEPTIARSIFESIRNYRRT